jgi:succinate dehydrogenase / fumarate reductase cytochrome b subunit
MHLIYPQQVTPLFSFDSIGTPIYFRTIPGKEWYMSNASMTRAQSLPQVLITSSIGKKILMAVTGFVSFGYIVGHMAGNLQIFAGPEKINNYAEFLHSLGPILWVIRLILLAFFVLHIWLGIQLKLENMAARPVSYAKKVSQKSTLSARTMWLTGLMVFAFFVYHILQFTARVTDPRFLNLTDAAGRYDVYSMVILGFKNPAVSIFYIIAVGLLCYHLSHGIASMFQSIGWNDERYDKKLKALGTIVAILLFLGYISIPIAVLADYIKLPGGAL